MDIVNWLEVPRLRPHIGTLLLSYASWTAIQYGLAPALCRKVVGKDKWEKLNERAKNGWSARLLFQSHVPLLIFSFLPHPYAPGRTGRSTTCNIYFGLM